MSRIDEIKARLANRTGGKWIATGSTGVLGAGVVSAPAGRVIALKCQTDEDAEFIANAPYDMEWLLSELKKHITS